MDFQATSKALDDQKSGSPGQFSMQFTLAEEWSDDEFNTRLGLAFFPNALKMVEFFGPRVFGKVVECQGTFGYDAKRIRQFELSYCNPLDFKEPPSQISKLTIWACMDQGVFQSARAKALRVNG